ncbi:hypothetical protein AB4560_13145 [Vibrio sp. 10N.222.51.C12]|uniref:hypothetical protein n=1 Tax=unclassified Vibrio TaxID=2614977 RepID=UPI000C81F65A|nr:hypothetical protein [Vibrio sp. 10N.286.48.B7]PMH77717.1 hypothetical protein BCU58_12085 [Vibrio sp. 10N.286.48.B7]
MNIKLRLSWLVHVLILIGISSAAWAHNMRMSVYVEGSNLEGEIYYVGGGNAAASGATVELFDSGVIVGKTESDEDGLFVFASVTPGNYTVRGDAGQGHVATYDVNQNEFLGGESSSSISANGENEKTRQAQNGFGEIDQQQLQIALSKAIRPLREQIDRYEAKTRFHDILGGIGYVFGLFGLFVMLKQRRQLWS